MSERFFKGIFLIFGFCFFVELIWLAGAHLGIAEPFCILIGKDPLKCSEQGKPRVAAKQFCLGQGRLGYVKKKKKKNNDDESAGNAAMAMPTQDYTGQNGFVAPQGYVTQDQLRAQQLYQQQLLQQQQQQQQE